MTRLLRVLLLFFATNAWSQQSSLVINEVYVGSSANAGDQFIEIYNAGTATGYLDGMVIARFGAAGSASGGSLQSVADAWKFPGEVGGTSYRLRPGEFAVIAANAKSATNGLDLSAATYETFIIQFLDQDNGSVPNLTRISGFTITDLKFTPQQDAVVLSDGTDATVSDGLTISSIVDAVQISSAGANGKLPLTLDRGVAGEGALKAGVSMERKVKGVTSGNSGEDFEASKPSPGFQHGQEVAISLKGTDIFPLGLGYYVSYDSYVIDAASERVPSSLTYASTTNFRTGLVTEGRTGVTSVRDTANRTFSSAGQINDVRYVADAKGDILAYADKSFFSLFFPDALSSLIQAPDSFVSYIKLSGGANTSYPILSISQKIPYQQGIELDLDIVANGVFQTVESVSVQEGTFDSAYKFIVNVQVSAAAGAFSVLNATIPVQIWLVEDIGIVRTFTPAVDGQTIPIDGAERTMTAHGIRQVSSVQERENRSFMAHPNPFSDELTVEVIGDQPIQSARFIDLLGNQFPATIRASGASATLSADGMAAGSYLLSLRLRDGQTLTRFVQKY